MTPGFSFMSHSSLCLYPNPFCAVCPRHLFASKTEQTPLRIHGFSWPQRRFCYTWVVVRPDALRSGRRGKLGGFTSASPVFLSKLKQRFNLVMRNDGSVSAPPFFLSKSKPMFRFGLEEGWGFFALSPGMVRETGASCAGCRGRQPLQGTDRNRM